MGKKQKDIELLAAHFDEANPLRLLVVTLSDRASAGVYEDKSGPLLRSHLDKYFEGSGVGVSMESKVLTDDAAGLRDVIREACDGGTHALFTTGGTGIGPRDNTTDVVLELADKVVPGIMEGIRMKYAIDKPCALLSRTVAATIGGTMVYTLPGSSKGVEEYMTEIVRSLDHVLCVLNGLEVH